MNNVRTYAFAAVASLALFATDANARGGSHAHASVTVGSGGFVRWAPMARTGPLMDATGRIISTAPRANTGIAPALQDALDNPNASSEARYRAELCRTVGSHVDQLACFERK